VKADRGEIRRTLPGKGFGEHDRGAGESKTVANGRKRTWRPVYQVYQAPLAYFRQLA
jgi:hypothetical protein